MIIESVIDWIVLLPAEMKVVLTAALLILAVATEEDRQGYRKPVTFWPENTASSRSSAQVEWGSSSWSSTSSSASAWRSS